MKTKIYVGDRLLGRFTCDGRRMTRLQAMVYRVKWYGLRVALVIVAIDALGWASVAGYNYAKGNVAPLTVYAEKITEVPVNTFPPMLTKICNAESGGKQFNKDGSVLRGRVNPSDIGFCQLNEPIWNDKARKMGLDIYTEQGNKDMALYIFSNYGTDPWNSSKVMWSK